MFLEFTSPAVLTGSASTWKDASKPSPSLVSCVYNENKETCFGLFIVGKRQQIVLTESIFQVMMEMVSYFMSKKDFRMRKLLYGSTLALATMFSMGVSAVQAAPLPPGAICVGNCGTDGADGVVTLSPLGTPSYLYISTSGGQSGAGEIAGVGGTNGSQLTTPSFHANAGDVLQFYFNYVTSDGSGYADYSFAELLDSTNAVAATLFTARTQPSGDTSPGFGLPANDSTLTPSSSAIIPGGPAWSVLGGSSGQCFATGCGYTGWIQADYTIATSGNYSLTFGATNWSDTAFDSGLAIDGVTIAGNPVIPTPEPASLSLMALGLIGLGAIRRRS